ncbi:hypothetical protein [Achromobacter insolitus]|uniref:hypothetical protein n=1 Tax=Achromobacter insolitus TaxID=217204 RepID=UPI0017488103|nr:hypothetical protein [Achromobacter insolitus]
MRNAAPMTFGARLAAHRLTAEEADWFFNVPAEQTPTPSPEQPELTEKDHRIQVGPLDV